MFMFLSTIYSRTLFSRTWICRDFKNMVPSYCPLSLMLFRYLEYSVIFMSINLLISRFFEILNYHNNNILATEILIFWKKNSLYSISHEQIFNQKALEMAEDTKGIIRRTNNTPANRRCSEKVSRPRSTIDTCRVTFLTNPLTSHEW
jgi:hypothetical protein